MVEIHGHHCRRCGRQICAWPDDNGDMQPQFCNACLHRDQHGESEATMMRDSIVEDDGVLHMVWSMRGVGTPYPVTYCGREMRYKLEAQTSLVTCAECLATRWRHMSIAARSKP